MVDINWEEAPEGTTHVLLNLDGTHNGHWRRVEGGVVCDRFDGRWCKINDAEVWFREFAVSIVERPPKESPLPNGLQWVEGALYYSPSYGGFFLNDERFTTNGGRSWNPIGEAGLKYWLDRPDTIRRYADGQAPQIKAEQPKPVVKKQVGWWS